MERFLDKNGFEGKKTYWEDLSAEIGLDKGCLKTVKRELVQKDWMRYIACRKGWVDDKLAIKRVKFAEESLRRRPDPDDWKNVRFSDESHFGWGLSKTARIIRRKGTRYCADCL